VRRGTGNDQAFRRARKRGGFDMGSGPGVSCAVSLNTSLTPEQRARYQDLAQINDLLDKSKTIAIVGLSSDRQKASFFVAGYLKDEGYRIVPVNPKAETILGEKVYPDVASIPFPVDVIDIFRPPQDIDEIVTQAIARKEKGIDSPAIWMQLRLVNLPAAERALAAGLTVIVDKCVKMEHGRYRGGLHFAGMNTEIISARKRTK
jgi:predicted CoA-binding protein